MIVLEFAFDEIMNILSIAKFYNKEALFDIIEKFICANSGLPDQNKPASVALAGSCMQIIHRNMFAAIRYFDENNANKMRVYIGSDIYYEVCLSLGITQDFYNSQYVTFDGMYADDVHNHNNQIVDLMLLQFHANVNRQQRGFVGHDVKGIIEKQFKLRAKCNFAGQLIVVLDVALTSLSDPQIKDLLNHFASEIEFGNLAIVMTTSLNKYCQNGFDRFPSGLSALFYSPKHFPGFSSGSELIAFSQYDVIPQTVAHCLTYAGSSVRTFYDMVHDNSRYIHDNIVPSELYDDKKPIHIDSPYTNDEHRKPWGFVVIRFANDRIAEEYRPKLQAHLDSIGFEYRNGFGFNNSTYAFIGANLEILRISIGPNAQAEQYKKLVDYITTQNANTNQYVPKCRARL